MADQNERQMWDWLAEIDRLRAALARVEAERDYERSTRNGMMTAEAAILRSERDEARAEVVRLTPSAEERTAMETIADGGAERGARFLARRVVRRFLDRLPAPVDAKGGK